MTDLDSAAAPPVAASAPVIQRWTDGTSWDRFVAAAGDSTLAHRWAWRDVVTGTYRHHVINLAAVRGPRLTGVLPLTLVRSRLFGRALVSMPYLDAGGLCTHGDPIAEEMLIDAARELAARHHAPLELRHQFPKEIGVAANLEKVTLTLDISGGEDDAWSRIRSNRRSQIRKARRCGLTATVRGVDGVGAFYRVWSRNMRDLGSPVHPRSFFERILIAFPGEAWVVLVEDGPHPVGAGIVIRHQDRVVLPWSSSVRSSLPKGPNQLLYWEAIRHAVCIGATTFDFGRSSRGAGTFDAKREWGAEPVQLYWHGAGVDTSSSRLDQLAWATRLWQRMPVPMTVAIGSRVRGGITR